MIETSHIELQRFPDFGKERRRPIPKRRRYCEDCRERRKRETAARFEQRHPGRAHRALDRSTVTAGRARNASDGLSEAGQ